MYGSGTVAGPRLAGAGRARESCLRERAGAGWHNLSRATLYTAPQAYTLYTPDIERSGLVLDMLCLKPKTAKINLGLNYRATYIPELPVCALPTTAASAYSATANDFVCPSTTPLIASATKTPITTTIKLKT